MLTYDLQRSHEKEVVTCLFVKTALVNDFLPSALLKYKYLHGYRAHEHIPLPRDTHKISAINFCL